MHFLISELFAMFYDLRQEKQNVLGELRGRNEEDSGMNHSAGHFRIEHHLHTPEFRTL